MNLKPEWPKPPPETTMHRVQELNKWFAERLADITFPNHLNCKLAAALLGASLSHFNAMCYLLQAGAYASTLALLRVQWESYLNATWIHQCVSDEAKLMRLWDGKQAFPKIPQKIKDIEKVPIFAEGSVLTGLQVAVGKAMNELTHPTAFHMRRWLTKEGIEPNYDREEVSDTMLISGRIALYSATGFAILRDDGVLEDDVYEQYLAFNRAPRPGEPGASP